MPALAPGKWDEQAIPVGTAWLLGACMEARGKQDLWIQQKPEVLDVLREQAAIQSVESSNRIEGVTVEANRLRPLIIGKARPRDRSEEELAGYRRALDWIFSRKRPAVIAPNVLLRLHLLAQGGASSPLQFSGDAGEWKKRDNQIIEILPNGDPSVRFIPVAAKGTPAAVELLCQAYRANSQQQNLPPLLNIATLVFDLLCIHPFRDGNGRVSRLATTFLLESQGFRVARYVSLERLVEERKEEYYRVLQLCSRGWHEGENEIVPWWNYFLSILLGAWKEFQHKVEFARARPARSDLARQSIIGQVGEFTLADIAAQLPAVSPQLVKKVLAAMKQAGQVRLSGRGRGARWIVV